jgi:predicted PurR-regulated permease PerM
MLGLEARIARYAWTVVLILLFVGFLYVIRQTLFVFVVALLFSYLLWPLVHFLEQRLPGRSKIPSLAIVYLLLLTLTVVVGTAVGSRVSDQANALISRIPELLSKLEQSAGEAVPRSFGMRIVLDVKQQIAEHARDLLLLASNTVLSLVSHAEILLFVVLVPILSFFFLKDGRRLLSSLLGRVADGPRRAIFNDIADDLHLLLAKYMRALVLLGLATATSYSIFFTAIGLPYGLLLGVIAFFFEFVPLLGPLTSAFLILLVAALSGFGHILWILIFLAIYRLFQDYVLSPHILSSGTELHPLAIIFGVLAGGQLAGIPGTFLSVPVLATLRIVLRQVKKQRLSEESEPAPVP